MPSLQRAITTGPAAGRIGRAARLDGALPRLSPLARLASRVSRLSNWELLGRFARPPLNLALILFPVVSVVPVLAGAGSLAPMPVPFVLLHGGLGLLFVGVCLHRWRAPELVQRYQDSFDYVRTELEVVLLEPATKASLRVMARQLARYRHGLMMIHPECVLRLTHALAVIERSTCEDGPPDRTGIAEWMLASWLFTTHIRPLARGVVAFCYGAGILLLAAASLTVSAHYVLDLVP